MSLWRLFVRIPYKYLQFTWDSCAFLCTLMYVFKSKFYIILYCIMLYIQVVLEV